MHLKATLIVLVGVPVCAGILTAFPLLWVMARTEGPPLPQKDLVAGIVFCLGAVVVVAMSVAAFMRVRSAGGSVVGWLPMLVPLLVLAGVAGGGKFGWDVAGDRREANDRHDAELCGEPAFWGVDQATCLTRARGCRQTSWRSTPPAKGDPAYGKLTAAIVATRGRLDQEAMAKAKESGFGYEPPRFYDGLLDTLSSSYEFAVYDRATMSCLFESRKESR